MMISGIEDISGSSSYIPIFNLMNNEQKVNWLFNQAEIILKALSIDNHDTVDSLKNHLRLLDIDATNVQRMKHEDVFKCYCGKEYKREGNFRKHLSVIHKWEFHSPSKAKDVSGGQEAVSCFLRMALLLHDTNDSYKMADGERCLRNSKLEWLYARSVKHFKYQLWLWRMISYVIALLSPRESFEYKWNICQNLEGGINNNIPNDNCVELQVHKIKRQLQTQGANKSFDSAKLVTLTIQVVDALKKNLNYENETVRSARIRPGVDKSIDIKTIASCIINKAKWTGQKIDFEWTSFSKFRSPLDAIDTVKLHDWIVENKKVANVCMIKKE
jgi:uncharacterized C2H2 Zn-finger protein